MRAVSVDRLCCPLCHGALRWSEERRVGAEIVEAVVTCPSCGTRSEVLDGVGVFLPGDAAQAPADLAEGGPAPAEGPGASEWSRAVRRTWEVARGAVSTATGPVIVLDLDGSSAPPPDGSWVVAPRRRAVPPRPGPAPTWDGLVADVHSLPFVNRAAAAGVLGPGWQELPGPHVLLRELRRTVDGPLVAIVAVPVDPGPGTTDGARPTTSESETLEEFRRARLRPELLWVEEVGLPAAEDGTARTVRWGVVTARPPGAVSNP